MNSISTPDKVHLPKTKHQPPKGSRCFVSLSFVPGLLIQCFTHNRMDPRQSGNLFLQPKISFRAIPILIFPLFEYTIRSIQRVIVGMANIADGNRFFHQLQCAIIPNHDLIHRYIMPACSHSGRLPINFARYIRRPTGNCPRLHRSASERGEKRSQPSQPAGHT